LAPASPVHDKFAVGGKGIGSQLVKGALDQVRADGLKVVAQCQFRLDRQAA
jgi:predicted GNAT family acetyltransferase